MKKQHKEDLMSKRQLIDDLLAKISPKLRTIGGFWSNCVNSKERVDALEIMHEAMKYKWNMTQLQMNKVIRQCSDAMRSYATCGGYRNHWLHCQTKLIIAKDILYGTSNRSQASRNSRI